MKQEIYKFSQTNYFTIFHKDHVPFVDEDQHFNYEKNDRLIFLTDSTSTDPSVFVENFANQLCTVTKFDTMVVLEKVGETKISLKLFHGYKRRIRGFHWFKTSRNVDFLTVNLLGGDVYSGFLNDYNKKKQCIKHIRRNFFSRNPISELRSNIIKRLPLDREESVKIADKAINLFCNQLFPQKSNVECPNHIITRFYLEKKGIKYPNNFQLYFKSFGLLPKLKNLRKHNMKLVDAFMSDYDLKGDVIKKAIHNVKQSLGVSRLKYMLGFFPEEWVLQDKEFLEACLDYDSSTSITLPSLGALASKSELRKVFILAKEVLNHEFAWSTFYDHCEFYYYLKSAGENIKWKSKNLDEFTKEHLDWADLYEFYKRGFYTRIYPQSLYDAFKIPIQHKDEVYYPIILTNSEEYNAESFYQNNCVKTYIGRPSSIIISLRKGSTISNDRATIEYLIFRKVGIVANPNTAFCEVDFVRPQSLGKFNSTLSQDWIEPLKLLDERMTQYIGNGKNITTVKIEKLLTNHKVLKSDSEWAENGFLFWTYNLIDKQKLNYFF